MFWFALIIAGTIALLAYSPRTMTRLLVALTIGWIFLAYYAKGGDPDPGLVFAPLIALWGGVILVAWIVRPAFSRSLRPPESAQHSVRDWPPQ